MCKEMCIRKAVCQTALQCGGDSVCTKVCIGAAMHTLEVCRGCSECIKVTTEDTKCAEVCTGDAK